MWYDDNDAENGDSDGEYDDENDYVGDCGGDDDDSGGGDDFFFGLQYFARCAIFKTIQSAFSRVTNAQGERQASTSKVYLHHTINIIVYHQKYSIKVYFQSLP